MTRAEFDTWIEQHYSELLKVAKKRSSDSESAVQDAVLTFLTNRDLSEVAQPWTYLVNALRSTAGHQRRGDQRSRTLRRDLKKDPSAGHSLGWKRPGVSRACSDPTKSWEDAR